MTPVGSLDETLLECDELEQIAILDAVSIQIGSTLSESLNFFDLRPILLVVFIVDSNVVIRDPSGADRSKSDHAVNIAKSHV